MSEFATALSGQRPPAGWSYRLPWLLVIAGVLMLLLPFVSGVVVTLVVGWIIVLAGIPHLILAWAQRSAGAAIWEMLIGILYEIAGFYLIFHPVRGLASVTLLLALYLFFKGILEIVNYFQLGRRRGTGWLAADGLVNFVLAVMIWSSWPFSSAWAIGTLLGISLLFSGASRLMYSSHTRRSMTTV